MIGPKRRPGRPPVDGQSAAPSARVHLALGATDYDKIFQLASRAGLSVPAVIRLSVKRLLRDAPRTKQQTPRA